MKKIVFPIQHKPYLQAAALGVVFYLIVSLTIIVFKPAKEQIRQSNLLIEGTLIIENGGFRNGGFVTIGHTAINLSTDLIGSNSGSAALRGTQNNSYVKAESVFFPTLFKNKLVVIKIYDKQGVVIYERSVDRLIDIWVSLSLGLGALAGFLISVISFVFFQHAFQTKPLEE